MRSFAAWIFVALLVESASGCAGPCVRGGMAGHTGAGGAYGIEEPLPRFQAVPLRPVYAEPPEPAAHAAFVEELPLPADEPDPDADRGPTAIEGDRDEAGRGDAPDTDSPDDQPPAASPEPTTDTQAGEPARLSELLLGDPTSESQASFRRLSASTAARSPDGWRAKKSIR